MEERCENCGQLALDSDSVCWHCGQPLPGREQSPLEKVPVREGWQQTLSLPDLGMYVGLTILVVVATLLVQRALGQRPLVQANLDTRPPAQWGLVTDANLSFMLHLPDSWKWYDGADEHGQAEFSAQVASNDLFSTGTYPLGSEVPDMELIFLAVSPQSSDDQPPAFLVVGQSARLNRLTYDDAVRFLQEGKYRVSEAKVVEESEMTYASIIVEKPMEGDDSNFLRCRQRLIQGQETSLLLSLCAPNRRYSIYQQDFESIMNSFQRLTP